jgi:hypothetical protein
LKPKVCDRLSLILPTTIEPSARNFGNLADRSFDGPQDDVDASLNVRVVVPAGDGTASPLALISR